MLNILITAIGGDIGQGVLKSLRLTTGKMKIVGTDLQAEAAGLFMADKGYIVKPVRVNQKEYLKQILAICKKEEIDIAFVCNEDEQLSIASFQEKIKKEVKTYFVVQPTETILICRDKLKMHKFLSKKGVRTPFTCVGRKNISKLIKKFGFPIALKPRGGYGGYRKFSVVNNKVELDNYLKSDPGAAAMEYITNKNEEEYTVGIFLDKNSKALGAIAMLRKLRFSLTWHAIVDDYPDITKIAIRAAESVKAIGPCNVQLRRDKENRPCVIEINTRISSTAIFRAKLGFNEARAAIDYFLKNKKPNLRFKKGVVMRIWDELIIPTGKYKKLKRTGKISN